MTLRDKLQVIIGGIGGLLAAAIYNYFTAANVSPLASAIFGGGATIIFVSLAPGLCLDEPLRWSKARQRFLPEARYEGYWFIEVPGVEEARRYAIGHFRYRHKERSYSFDGWATDLQNWRVSAKWWSSTLALDTDKNVATYTYKSEIIDVAGRKIGEEGRDVPPGAKLGYGKIWFEAGDKVCDAAHGSFTDDFGARPVATKYEMRPISPFHLSEAGWDAPNRDLHTKLLDLARYMRNIHQRLRGQRAAGGEELSVERQAG